MVRGGWRAYLAFNHQSLNHDLPFSWPQVAVLVRGLAARVLPLCRVPIRSASFTLLITCYRWRCWCGKCGGACRRVRRRPASCQGRTRGSPAASRASRLPGGSFTLGLAVDGIGWDPAEGPAGLSVVVGVGLLGCRGSRRSRPAVAGCASPADVAWPAPLCLRDTRSSSVAHKRILLVSLLQTVM